MKPRELWRGFNRLTQLGWPQGFPIVQFPNPPLILALVLSIAAAATHGPVHTYLAATSLVALAVWASEELVLGVNWFRRLLGLGIAIYTVAHLAAGLGS